jgi:hypothetical protein
LPRDDLHAFFKDSWTPGTVNRSIYSTATHHPGIGCVDDGIGTLPGNVTLQQRELSFID